MEVKFSQAKASQVALAKLVLVLAQEDTQRTQRAEN